MAIVTPAGIQIADEFELLLPQMAKQPLQKALENVNYLWKYYRPALVSFAPTADAALTRQSEYHIPITPSVDGIRYSFESRFVCSAATQNVTVSVEYTTAYVAGGASVWVGICSDVVASSGTAGALTTFQKADQTIPATAVALRWTLTAPAAGNRTDHHFLAYPTPAAPVAGVQASGYIPFDDTLLQSAQQAAVHTEWINRCKASTVALLRDRLQCAYSFGQEYRTAPRWSTVVALWRTLPPCRVWLPGQTGTVTLMVQVICDVDAGGTNDLLRIRQTGVSGGGGASLLLDASGAIESGTLDVQIQGAGLLSFADLELAIISSGGGNKTRPFAVMAWHTPTG